MEGIEENGVRQIIQQRFAGVSPPLEIHLSAIRRDAERMVKEIPLLFTTPDEVAQVYTNVVVVDLEIPIVES